MEPVTLALRWGDLDVQGHVNNAMVTEYLQEARGRWLLHTPNAHLLQGGVVVVRNQVEYVAPILFDKGPVTARVALAQVGAARFVVVHELFQADRQVARARVTLCPFDFLRQRPRRLTPDERECFRSMLDDDIEMRELEPVHLRGRGHGYELQVRWGDLDSYGHVNNVRYFDYLQEARIAMTTAADPSMARAGMAGASDHEQWLIVRQDVDHLVQMSHREDPYLVSTAVARIGETSVMLVAEIVDPARERLVLARGRTVLVRADAEGRPTKLSASTREALADWQV